MSTSTELEGGALASRSGATQVTPGTGGPWHDPEALVGALLNDRYRIDRLIGQGGMGAVYLAEHVVIGKTIAVKVLSPEYSQSQSDVQRFLQEARAASLIRHDHIVDISDFGYTQQGQAYLVMEYLAGEDLAHVIAREGRMGWFRVTNMMLQIGSALAAAHAKGVIHRDMKPENCFLVRREDSEDFVKVLDFGIAKIVDERIKQRAGSLTAEGGIIGTPEYIAPELVRGQKPDTRVDIYALGVIMYRLLTGVLPFTTDTGNYMAILSAHLLEEVKKPRLRAPEAQIPREIEAIVLRALAKDPSDRYQTVDEMIAAIREAQMLLTGASSTGILVNIPTIKPRTLRASRRRRQSRWLWPVIGLAGAALGGLAVFLALGPRAPGPTPAEPVPAAMQAVTPVTPVTPATPPPEPARPPEPPPEPAGGSEGEAAGAAESGEVEAHEDGRPATLSEADFRREVEAIQRDVKSKCSGLPGMQIRARIYVDPDGTVSRVVPEGTLAGSSFGTCVVKQIRAARFKKATRSTVRSASFKL